MSSLAGWAAWLSAATMMSKAVLAEEIYDRRPLEFQHLHTLAFCRGTSVGF
jgi:hypothetical protein